MSLSVTSGRLKDKSQDGYFAPDSQGPSLLWSGHGLQSRNAHFKSKDSIYSCPRVKTLHY